MKNTISLILIVLAGLLGYSDVRAGNCDPDSLTDFLVTGVIDVQVIGAHEHYFLITEVDTFRLNFGPWWYMPTEGDAIKPNDGDTVEIFGGLNTTTPGLIFSVIVVYEIDGEFWRNPYDPIWNHFNNLYSSDPDSLGKGVACGWPDSNVVIEIFSGAIMLDTTLRFYHYFLDTDYDGLPDYRLNLGPPWYEPIDDMILPGEGDIVTIEGAILHTAVYPIIIVLTIDGLVWRDEDGFGDDRFGKWMHGNKNDALSVVSPFDTLSQIQFMHGWHRGGMPGSMFCQLLELHHQNMFRHQEHKAIAGFEIGFLNQQRHNMMNDSQYRHGMRINNNVRLQFHYVDSQMVRARVRANERLHLYCWDTETESWVEEPGINVDTIAQLVSVETDVVYPFYMITAEEFTSASFEDEQFEVNAFLRPNPAGYETYLRVNKPSPGHVRVSIYSINGELINTVLNADKPAGILDLTIWTGELSAGMYYVVLDLGSARQSLPLIVVR